MGDLADVKRKRMYRLLRWIETKEQVTVKGGGNHLYLVKHPTWDRPFPIPFKDGVVNKYIVKEFMNLLITAGVCTEEEFRNQIK